MKAKKALARPSSSAPKKRLLRVPAKKAVKSAVSPRRAWVMKPMPKSTVTPALTAFERAVANALGRVAARAGIAIAHIPKHLEKPVSWRTVTVAMIAIVAIIGTTAGIVSSVSAATYQGPTQVAPGGNIPFTIWNRTASSAVQTNAAIAIDGGGPAATNATGVAVGLLGSGAGPYSSTLDLDSTNAGQNVYYGAAAYTTMNSGDALFKLETYNVADTPNFTTRFSVDKDGRVGGTGCRSAIFVGLTASSFHGSLGPVGSYFNSNARCNSSYPGSHVCRPDELLESISCSRAGDPILNAASNGKNAWLNGGPPGHTSLANDCLGWQSTAASAYGRTWTFDSTTGGYGALSQCDTGGGLQYACCR